MMNGTSSRGCFQTVSPVGIVEILDPFNDAVKRSGFATTGDCSITEHVFDVGSHVLNDVILQLLRSTQSETGDASDCGGFQNPQNGSFR